MPEQIRPVHPNSNPIAGVRSCITANQKSSHDTLRTEAGAVAGTFQQNPIASPEACIAWAIHQLPRSLPSYLSCTGPEKASTGGLTAISNDCDFNCNSYTIASRTGTTGTSVLPGRTGR